ncbi:hypothetical protein LJC28_02335 [Dysgonomonas sp. OttesenSCG-928-D17]|nr:hypothetical protein [Dysgonomonas sp. OttesenSCG-928-D17]
MKLSSLAPNARYDLVHGKPSVFEKDNDGSHLYRFNIEPEMGIKEGETEETQIGWMCCEIRVWETPSKGVIKKAIIRSVLDESAEFSLVNSYNKHVLKIKVDATAVDKYKEYLTFTEDVETLLANDFSNETN